MTVYEIATVNDDRLVLYLCIRSVPGLERICAALNVFYCCELKGKVISFEPQFKLMELKQLIEQIVSAPELHAKWLNSLSMMENTGAKKISASEHDLLVDEIVLKHAAEEARHAYYLKSQIKKTGFEGCKTYQMDELLAPIESFQYLHALDTSISRYLKKKLDYTGSQLKYAAYLLVTYAIEVRADELYPIYEEVLKSHGSKISVRMIVVEEKGHLEEMIQQMDDFFEDWAAHGEFALSIENKLFSRWTAAIQKSLEEQPLAI